MSDPGPGGVGERAAVVSLGSVNVDRVHQVSEADLATLEDRYDWFPERGETVRVDDLPPEFPADPDSLRHGGKGANQAVAAARAGATTDLLGTVGPDSEAFGVREHLAAAGVGCSRIETAPDPTGTADVFVDPTGENSIVVRPGANGAVDDAYMQAQSEAVRAADCLLLQNEIPVEPVARLLSDLADEPDRPVTILDPAPADGVERLLGCAAVDYLTPNETEYRALASALNAFDGVLVRKRGADDVVVEGARRFSVPPPTVDAVDTTGAGDVLNGVLAARLVAGDSVREAVEVGVVAASLATRTEGAQRGVPTLDRVRAYRASGDG
jgi:ribokinase